MTASLRALSRGDVVATVIDQAPAKREHGDVSTFLGAPALVDRSPAILAKRARATVIAIVAARDGDVSRVRIALELGADEIRALAAPAIMRLATAHLDAHVRAHPECWLWLHRRWKNVPLARDVAIESTRPARPSNRSPRPAARSFNPAKKAVIERP